MAEDINAMSEQVNFALKVRDKRIKAVNESQDAINAGMQKMMELGKDIETEMKSAVVGYNSGVEELKELSSNDL